MSDAFIVGADMIKFGRYPDKNPYQLAAEAALLALDDAGLTIKDVGAVYAGSTFNAASMVARPGRPASMCPTPARRGQRR